jgi:two-component system, NtrC family, sensor histidine kinase KinB
MKKRIIIGLAPIFVLIVAMGAYAILLFAKLGSQVDVVLRENYRSVVAGQKMKEAAERMDSAQFFSLVGEEQRGRSLYADYLPKFEEGLETELGNITVPGEDRLAHSIQSLHARYSRQADIFWKTSDVQARRDMYFHDLLPVFTEIKDTAQAVISLNQDNMLKSDREARDLSDRSTRYMVFASILGIAAAIFFAARLQKSVLLPIQTLTAVSKELGEGKLDQIVPVESKDELGELADAFNKLAGKLRAYRQITSDQILQARQMTETTFSAFPDPIVALSTEGVIDFTNPAAITLFHKIGSEGTLPNDVQKRAEKVLKGGPDYLPTSFEKTVVVRVDDKEVFLLPRVIGMRDESGNVYGAAVILQDVTRLRLLDEVKSNLVSTVSHELKTPLTSVRMGLYLLLEERIGTLNPKQTELLLAAREDSERLLEMINDLLDLAKLESGKVRLNSEEIDAERLVQTVFGELEAAAESHGSKLAKTIEPGLPMVRVDLQQISHVFTNLVSNAVKHSPRGEAVALAARSQDGMVRFSVTDHGPGIPEEFQPRVFERFFRVAGDSAGGAGLGLAIAKEIVTAHGGHIGLNSKPGQGCEFYFDLPPAQKTMS